MQPHGPAAVPDEPIPSPRRPHLREVAGAVPGPVAGPSCNCGHGKQAHEHYRRGSDCALCGCGKFSRPLLVRLGLRSG